MLGGRAAALVAPGERGLERLLRLLMDEGQAGAVLPLMVDVGGPRSRRERDQQQTGKDAAHDGESRR